MTAQVRNTGGRALDLSGELTLARGPGGLSAGPFPAQLGTTVAPGQTEPVTVPLSKDLPDGPWTAHIHLASGLTGRTAQATITFPHGAGAAPPSATLDASGRYVTGAIGGGLTLLAALVFAGLRRNRRSARNPRTRRTPS